MEPFTADDMHRRPMGARKTELLDGEVIFYGGFDDTDLRHFAQAGQGASLHGPSGPATRWNDDGRADRMVYDLATHGAEK
jgi:hypothetical protein